MTVTFCGHRKVDNIKTISNLLYMHIENLIISGACYFLIGGYGEFDELAAKTIRILKAKYPYIESTNIIPYKSKKSNASLYDHIEYPPLGNVHQRYAIIKSNHYMVDKSDMVIAYIRRDTGGAFKTFSYAKRKHKKIILL
ncbi:MAG: hypothetical protein UH854_03985 [Clostridia bacterium]|nr:hypothetical protein [Clostridia bacterium]